jgi:hypothetical protein
MVISRLLPLALLAVTACEFGEKTIALGEEMIVVHGILNTTDRTQVVLLERSFTGSRPTTGEGRFDPNNPIVSGFGAPISGAVVTVTDAVTGLVMTAAERRTSNGQATGIYAISLNAYTENGAPAQIVRGRRYNLRVEALGKVATSSTLVPDAPAAIATPGEAFNRDHQAISLPIRDVQQARAYWIYLTAPFSAYSVFTLDQAVAISGQARNFFTDDLIRLFAPGFVQTLAVSAVDSNVYDYYRSGNDPFSGAGLISRIEGGLGLFGSLVVVDRRNLDVTQDPTGDPIEGSYTLRSVGNISNAKPDVPPEMKLYLESEGATDDRPDRISGSWTEGSIVTGIRRGAIFGTRLNDRLDLRVLTGQSTAFANYEFDLIVRGDSLRGSVNGRAPIVYVRAGK